MIPYLVVILIKFNDPVAKTLLEFGSLFFSIFSFYLCGYELLLKLGLYRYGDMVNLRQEQNRSHQNS